MSFFKSSDPNPPKTITNALGTFAYNKLLKVYKGSVDSSIGKNFALIFPVIQNGISEYQVNLFRVMDQNWTDFFAKLKEKNSHIDFDGFSINSVTIPDKEDTKFAMQAEVVLEKKMKTYLIVLRDFTIETIREMEDY